MKLIQCAAFVFLLLALTIPDETEALPITWFFAIAAKLSLKKLLKNAYYARCNTHSVPDGISCPSVVFGMGRSRKQAQDAARAYARTVGDAPCARYVGHCQISRFRGKK